MPPAARNVLLLAAIFCAVNAASAQQQFTATLQPALAPGLFATGTQWTLASPADLAQFSQKPPSTATVHVGTLQIADRNDLKFAAALVTLPGQQPCLYIDRDHQKVFAETSRVCFHDPPTDSSNWGLTADVQLPLPPGPFATFPITLHLPKTQKDAAPDDSSQTLIYSTFAVVMGDVDLPGRHLLIGYQYDPLKAAVDLHHGSQFADQNGDGKLDGMTERDNRAHHHGVAPVFHIASYYLRTSRVDLPHHQALLQSVPAAQYKRFDLWKGATLPDFAFTTLDGKPMKLSDLKGHLVLLDFWATWCGPCVADLPSKREIYAKYHARGLEILGLDGDDTTAKPLQTIAKLGLTWPQAKPSAELLHQRFHITIWPTFFLIDDQGHILTRDNGELQGDTLSATLDRMLPPK